MTWFKVDDRFWSHPKVLMTRLDAIGLWTITGSWCAEHLTDGRIPIPLLTRISPNSPATTRHLAEQLAEAGLWIQEGDTWIFHQWLDHQPSRTQVDADREAAKERRRRYEERRRAGATNPTVVPIRQEDQ